MKKLLYHTEGIGLIDEGIGYYDEIKLKGLEMTLFRGEVFESQYDHSSELNGSQYCSNKIRYIYTNLVKEIFGLDFQYRECQFCLMVEKNTFILLYAEKIDNADGSITIKPTVLLRKLVVEA